MREGEYLKTVDVGEEFGKEKVLALCTGEGSLKDGEGPWKEFGGSEVKEIVGEIVSPVSNEFGYAEKVCSFRACAGAVGSSPEDVK